MLLGVGADGIQGGREMKETIIGFIVLMVILASLWAASDSERLFIDGLHYIEFDGHQYVTNKGHSSHRVLIHSPKCKCLEYKQ